MFTGIIESAAKVMQIRKENTNLHLSLRCELTTELKIDQSVAHNGVCLTVVAIDGDQYTVTAIEETLNKTNIGDLKEGAIVNIERAMKMNARLDGHIVQGHVDQTAICTQAENKDGSWIFSFEYDQELNNVTIKKGSICINGVSLTVVDSKTNSFSVAIIPYTYEHTGFKTLSQGDKVNLEFDVIGKYVKRLMNL
ncbi:riboflavin synthase alpha chain [Nonlabens xylanidelens]|uniref:Riboflavin synthase n=1 Tax=Nonlabens xylanidelens TaxID=191564 RepID=A0A2S6IQG1_9FLAO|nr:riboflavin synthase [Nonlabens xylanidelens]PPK96492.1 riboflavin synthase alpha chain [Nonlabens xylanidelens]PQJ18210.1 riboflavin synthase subunit alpha [Nonlabens xylanidelens]